MAPLRTIAGACLLTLAVAGCGGGDSNKSSGSDESPATLIRQDGAAKTNVRTLTTEIEACFIDQQSYAACKQPDGTQLPIGSGTGQVEVSAATDAGYTIVSRSASGASFTMVKAAGGAATRACDKAGKGGCKTGGTW